MAEACIQQTECRCCTAQKKSCNANLFDPLIPANCRLFVLAAIGNALKPTANNGEAKQSQESDAIGEDDGEGGSLQAAPRFKFYYEEN